MTTYYVTADRKIITSPFNSPFGWILAEFPAEEPSIPFNPMTLGTDGYLAECEALDNAARQQAEEFLANLTVEQ